jgi:hypothetical protein
MISISNKYPIGEFLWPDFVSFEDKKRAIKTIQDFPKKLILKVDSLTEYDLLRTYRVSGWTIKQIVHHCADSHINSFVRFKLALTEDCPTIKPYKENLWAELLDTKQHSISSSLSILEGVHARWATLLNSMSEVDFNKIFIHPETNREISLAQNLMLYEWHCNHHFHHILIALGEFEI